MSKKIKSLGGLVYSTDPNFKIESDDTGESQETLASDKQPLKVSRDSKGRAGKMVTLVEGFIGNTEDLEALGKKLKTKCGSGGSVKDGAILIQGDYKDKIVAWLKEWGYSKTK